MRRRKFCRVKIPPVTILSAKSRNATFTRNSGAGQNEDAHKLNMEKETAILKSSVKDVFDERLNVTSSLSTCQICAMSKSTTEIASGAVRDIEPELRDLFSKVVERDPREAVKMLEVYPDEFVVKMLELLNPAAAMKILQRFNLSRR